ncbi:MAG TPA: tetratricopeptide repeat protein [Pyrinomonadaceae bacterium]|jgi:tetratricopeptide (TPR) repeat protein
MNRLECPRSGYSRGLLFILLSLLLALASVACSNPEKAKAEHLRRGEQYLKDKKYAEAALEFRNALQLDERLTAAHWGLAQAFEGQENFLPAIQELRRTLELDPNQSDAAIRLGNYYIVAYQGNREANKQLKDEAQKLADGVLQHDPNHVEAHILRATILYTDGKRAESLAELKHAVELNPQRIESLMSLARFYMQEHDAANAELTFQRALSVNDRSGLAHVQYGYFHVQQNDLAGAEAEFRKAIEVEPTNREARITLARFYLGNKQQDKAEQVFKDLAELDKDRPEGRSVLADFYATIGRYDDAIRVYQEIITRAPDYTQARYRLGEIMLQRGDVRGAEQQAQEVLSKNANDINARKLSARVNLQKGDAKKAVDDLAQVLKQEPRDQIALYFMTQAQLASGQIEQARSYAGDLDKYYPDYLPGKLLQAQIGLRAGGEENMKTAQRIATDLLDRLSRATPGGEVSPELLTELRSKAYTARGAAMVKLNNLSAARADFEAARAALPNAPETYSNLAGIAIAEKKPAEAEQLYEHALQIDNANLEALGGLINLYTKQQQLDRAHARVDQAIATQPNNAGLHFLKAQIFGIQQNMQATEAELRRTLELDANNAAALSALAALYVNMNKPQEAINEYRNVVARPPDTDDAAALTLIGMVEDRRDNRDAAIVAYKDALTRNPVGDIAAIAGNNLAWNYAEYGKGNLDEAVRLAQAVVQKYPDEPGYADTLGWVYFKKGLAGAAVEQLQKAVNQTTARGNDSAVYRLHLGRALAALGRKTEARTQLQQALSMGTEKKLLSPSQLEDARQALATL